MDANAFPTARAALLLKTRRHAEGMRKGRCVANCLADLRWHTRVAAEARPPILPPRRRYGVWTSHSAVVRSLSRLPILFTPALAIFVTARIETTKGSLSRRSVVLNILRPLHYRLLCSGKYMHRRAILEVCVAHGSKLSGFEAARYYIARG